MAMAQRHTPAMSSVKITDENRELIPQLSVSAYHPDPSQAARLAVAIYGATRAELDALHARRTARTK